MKNIFLTLSFLILSNIYLLGQNEIFTTGWYMIKTGAQVKVVQGNSDDATNSIDWSSINYSTNEVLIAFNFQKDKYYCYDPEGRVVLVKGKNSLQKIEAIGRPAHVKNEIKIGLDATLNSGNNVWLIGYNAANKTASILLVDGQKTEVPVSDVDDLKDYYDAMDKYTEWKTVE
jgi:hypothetical protein